MINMNPIENKPVFSHVRRDEWVSRGFGKPISHMKEFERKGLFSISEIRKSKGRKVLCFADLASLIAELGYQNHQYNLLFRGQNDDYKDKNGKTKAYPSIFRTPKNHFTKNIAKNRFEAIDNAIGALSKAREQLGLHSVLKNYREYYMALIQHYELFKTPMLDLTQSLLVAASFALQKNRTGYLYVFGMPHPHGSISHFIDDSLVLVKLQNVCPPEALRPHFQEGYLVGRLPSTKTKEAGDNIARRLIGKYFLDNTNRTFWKDGFKKIPQNVLYPTDDKFLLKLKTILNKTLDNKILP